MKKILHVSKYYYPFSGGTEQIARDCVISLKDSYEQKVIAFNTGKDDVRDTVDGIEVIRCGCFMKVASQSLSLSYKKILHDTISSFSPDIIIFHYPNPFVAFLLLPELKKDSDIKLVVYWHLDITKQKVLGKFFAPQNRKLLSRADKVIATSPNYVGGSPWLQSVKEKCVVIPNCINTERMEITEQVKERAKEIRKENEGRTICLSVGRHTEYKGFSYLIQASELLDDSFRFYITGEGELTEELKRLAEGNKRIVFTGRLDDSEMKAYLLACDIFCFSSITKNEAFGLALAEAMYYRKPAVTFTIPGSGVNYVCLNGEDGIEVPNRDTKAYAEAIKKLSNNKELRERYGENGYRRVSENFLNSQFRENIEKVVGSV